MKRKEMWKRGLVIVLSVAMISPFLPAEASAETTVPLLANFTFDDEASVLTGGNAKATVNGSYQLTDSKDAANGKALYLDGNAANYLAVTDADGKSLLAGKEEITVSYDAKPDQTATSWIFYAAPDTRTQSAPEYYIGAFANGGNTKVERYKNGRTVAFTAPTGTDWAHVDIVYSENSTSMYVNGLKAGSVDNSNAPLTDILGDSGILYIGRANWTGSGEGYKGWIDNFKIYDGALADDQLVSEDAAANAVASDKAALTLPEEVTGDFTLPSKGASYTTITWTAEKKDCAVIDDDGYTVKVTRPEGEHVEVVFTATIALDGVKDTKEFTVIVKAQPNDKNVLEDAVKALDIANKDDVRGNVNLPSEVTVEGTDKKVSVTWKSSDKTVVTDADAEGKAAGVVTRKEADTKVTMTATLTCGQETAAKTIDLNVKAAPKVEEKTDYLFAYFVNNGGAAEQQIFFASSHDGNNWMDLNKKEAVLSVADSVRTPEDLEKTQNQAGVRDPYLIRSPEGDRFYMIATDLCIGAENISAGTVGWGTAQYNGSHCLRIWESTDLVNWSEPWLADVAPSDTTCAWAPEAIYDDVTGQYVVYWASMTGSVQKVYYSLTRDFINFTEPAMFIDNGNDHIIDTTIVKDTTGTYYRGSAASGTIRIEKCTDTAQWLTNQSVWKEQGYIRDIAGFSAGLEGPELFMYNQDDWKEADGEKVPTYGLLADNYGSRGYVPFYTTDIANAKWVQTPDNDYNFDTLHKRHGTVISLTASEYDAVMEAYGPNSITLKTKPTKTTYETTDEQIDGTGLVLTVTYKNGKTEDITYNGGSKNARQFQFSEVDFSKTGKQTVTVTYGEQTATYEIEVKAGEEIEKKVLAQFDFDDETTGFVSDNAKAEGGYTLTDSSTTENGKAIYLDGTDANYLKVTDKNGGSLLTGARELTISFEAKTDRTETNWVFYAAPNDNTQSYTNERYIGVMIGGGKVTAERYNNSGSRPTSPSANVSGDWERIDVVLNRTSTAIYINGEKKAEEQSAYNIANLLGDSSILQVGKANWVNGEYYKGWLDNLTIRNYAMTAEEIAADIAGTPEDPVELPFVDVAEDAWYYDAVYYNYVVQTMTGKDDTHFAPDEALARAQFAMILYRMNDTPDVEYKATFPDVADNVWYTDAILWAADTGVVTGYSDSGKFGPSDRINREQMAVMMYRYAKYKEYESDAPADITGYADAGRVSAFAKEAMEWAVGNGIISGKDGGTVLDPQGNATRAECATIIMRFLEKFEK